MATVDDLRSRAEFYRLMARNLFLFPFSERFLTRAKNLDGTADDLQKQYEAALQRQWNERERHWKAY